MARWARSRKGRTTTGTTPQRSRRVRGSVLLLSLWATASLVAVQIAQATHLSLEAQWVDRRREAQQAWYVAWAGMELALARVAADDASVDTLVESWARPMDEPVTVGPGTVRVAIADEQARLCINALPAEILERLPGFTPETAAALIQHRGAAEAPHLLAHLGELATLPGFQPAQWATLEPLITVYGTDPSPVNLNTASVEVLTRLGFSEPLAQRIVELHSHPDGVFTDAGQIPTMITQRCGPLSSDDQQVLTELSAAQRLDIRSTFFRVTIEARTTRHGLRKTVVAVVERGREHEAPMIRGWYET